MIIARAFLSIFLFLTAFSSFGYAAGPGIMLEPLRVEFPEGKRYAIVTVFNQSHTEPVSYSISTLPLRMDENGGLYEPEEWTKRDFLTQSMIRFSPRTATIEA